jgi:phage-related protein
MDGMTLETLQVLIEAQTKGFRDEVAKVQNEVKKMTNSVNNEVNKVKSIFKSLGKFAATVGIGKFFVDSTRQAMKVEAAIQQITRTMGESTNQFLKWAKNNALAFNMSQSDAMNYGAVFSNLVSTFSSGTKETLQYTTDLLKASSVIASGTGRTMEDVMERIRSGLLGNTEAIEDLGVNVNVAMLKSTEAFNKFANGKSWDQLSFQTQQQIRLMAILEQTQSKFGGEVFNNTNSALQQLVAVLKDVALNIGNAFLPIMNVVLPILTGFALKLREVTSYIATFMNALFGTNISTSIKGQAASMGALASSTEDYNSALSDTGDTAKSTAKEVNRLLGGFDEINTLNKDSSSGDSGASGGSSIPSSGQLVDLGNFEFEQSTNGLESAVNKFKTLFAPVIDSFENLKSAVKPLVDNIGTILKWFWDNILVPFTTWTITQVMPQFFNILAGVFKILNPILESFMKLGAWLWDSFLQPIASWTGGVIVSILTGLASVLNSIGDWMKNNQGIVDAITFSLTVFFAVWKLTELLAFIQMSGGIAGAFATITNAIKACTVAKLTDKAETIYLTALYAKDFIMSIINGTTALVKQAAQWVINTGLKIADTTAQIAMNVAVGAWNVVCGIATTVTNAFGVAVAFLTSPIGVVIVAIGAIIAIITLLIKNWEEVKEVASNVWEGVKNVWVIAAGWFNSNVVKPIYNYFSNMWENIKITTSNAWSWILSLFTKGGQIFSGVVGAISDVFKTIVNSILKGINTVISAPFNTINGLLNKIRSVKILGLTPFDGFWGYNPLPIPQIPYLAKGGIIDSPTLAMVGEAGKEAVVPLENNKGGLRELASLLLAEMGPRSSNNDSFGDGDLILQIDGSVIGKVALKQLRKMQRQGNITLIPV